MEEYLANMKSLRSYMSDLEEDAAKRSAEEQQQRTAIDAHDADIALVRTQAKQVGEEAEQLAKARAQVCVEMAEKQGRIAALEVECATLKQTLELLHQETASSSAKNSEKRLFYTNTLENMTVKLQEQQEWLVSFKNNMTTVEPLVSASRGKQNLIEGQSHGMFNSEGGLDKECYVGKKQGELNVQFESAHLKLEGIKSKRSMIVSETDKVMALQSKLILEQEKNIITGFPDALQRMDIKSLEDEHQALQGDKAGEVEYFQSLEEQINGMKGVSDSIKCRCGLEYKVQLGGETAMDIN
ncbi:hypothetical protein ACP70R_022377 [Stipagrostis hirtigluma subsp. patula]